MSISLRIIYSKPFPNVASGNFSLFLWLGGIPVFHNITHTHTHTHLGCFHILELLNNASMNIGVMYLFEVVGFSGSICLFVYFGYIPGVQLLVYIIVLVFHFWESSILFYLAAVPIYILTSSVWSFCLFHILISSCYLCSFDGSQSDECEVMSHCGFDLQIPDD